MKHQALFSPAQLGGLTLKNRIVFPPLTRQRSTQPGDVASDLMAEYYRQRASAGFMVSEGTQIEPRGQGYAWTPGIYTPEQIDGWRKVTDAVHADGGVIFAQLWHVGRVSHHALQPEGAAPMLKEIAAAALVPPALVAVTLMVLEAAALGVPEMVPAVALNERPPGSVPLAMA